MKRNEMKVNNLWSPTNPKSETFSKISQFYFLGRNKTTCFVHSVANSDEKARFGEDQDDQTAIFIQNILKFRRDKSAEEIERALDRCGFVLTEDLVLNVLRRHRSDWKLAYVFFTWACKGGGGTGYLPGSDCFNEILDILGRMRAFDEVSQVLDEMSKREGLINEGTYGILLNRYAAAHRVEEAIFTFYKRKEFGLELNLVAFQKLLMWLCRYKHVEVAETLFNEKGKEFEQDIKTWNIILNGWCVRANVREAKRFWKDIIASKCKPDQFTYGIFINSLTKKGKLGTALKLFRAMWDQGCNPNVVTCSCMIDALCFKKRIPQALEVFQEMNVYELLDEMEQKGGSCLPNEVTFNCLLKSLKKPEEVPGLLERMEKSRCKMTSDTYNLLLKLYMEWDCEERLRYTWEEMERNGLGPDQRSYTIMIHGFHDKGRIKDFLRYFREMTSKGMIPEPRTEILVNSMNIKWKRDGGQAEKLAKGSDNNHHGSKEVAIRAAATVAHRAAASTVCRAAATVAEM
ncbi:Tetratricopeptide repeat-like superfamily protein [Prunus dulcis]|uniref:Tetratricopeptide repeat-like superfamily protein n=1 Tax=Prunus dulcis TaxID=3755 RepID=A0A4Y1RBY5_PRUDU|nr:Tetratricopeptide repeat-like superfamily protein [Prunus dulcis]